MVLIFQKRTPTHPPLFLLLLLPSLALSCFQEETIVGDMVLSQRETMGQRKWNGVMRLCWLASAVTLLVLAERAVQRAEGLSPEERGLVVERHNVWRRQYGSPELVYNLTLEETEFTGLCLFSCPSSSNTPSQKTQNRDRGVGRGLCNGAHAGDRRSVGAELGVVRVLAAERGAEEGGLGEDHRRLGGARDCPMGLHHRHLFEWRRGGRRDDGAKRAVQQPALPPSSGGEERGVRADEARRGGLLRGQVQPLLRGHHGLQLLPRGLPKGAAGGQHGLSRERGRRLVRLAPPFFLCFCTIVTHDVMS
ncbi:hypothetical protein QOT17_022097 [Balamuthia mandrillaris]